MFYSNKKNIIIVNYKNVTIIQCLLKLQCSVQHSFGGSKTSKTMLKKLYVYFYIHKNHFYNYI